MSDKKYICAVEHKQFGKIDLYETRNGARVYGKHPVLGIIPCQDKRAQEYIRGLVIAAGHGDKLARKPSALEVANHAPEEKPEKSEDFSVHVTDNLPGQAAPEKQGIVKRAKSIFFGMEDALK